MFVFTSQHDGDEKYLVLRLVDRVNTDEGYFALVSEALMYHSDIYDKFK